MKTSSKCQISPKAALTPLQFSGILRTELLTPESNRLIRDNDSAFGEKILHISEAQAETTVNPDGIADDFCWETMTVIARPIVLHGTSVSVRCPSWQCRLKLSRASHGLLCPPTTNTDRSWYRSVGPWILNLRTVPLGWGLSYRGSKQIVEWGLFNLGLVALVELVCTDLFLKLLPLLLPEQGFILLPRCRRRGTKCGDGRTDRARQFGCLPETHLCPNVRDRILDSGRD